jgi:hypothetical protein
MRPTWQVVSSSFTSRISGFFFVKLKNRLRAKRAVNNNLRKPASFSPLRASSRQAISAVRLSNRLHRQIVCAIWLALTPSWVYLLQIFRFHQKRLWADKKRNWHKKFWPIKLPFVP